jgi:hypothetical protein
VAAVVAAENFSVAIVGASPPALLSQPPDETVWAGQPATFTVSAVGTPPLNFQWQFNGEIIEEATNSFYRINRAAAEHAGAYGVIVNNTRGAAASRECLLNVKPNPGILVQPTNQTGVFGGRTTLWLAVESQTPVSIQWFFNGSAISGATNALLALSELSAASAGDYWCWRAILSGR